MLHLISSQTYQFPRQRIPRRACVRSRLLIAGATAFVCPWRSELRRRFQGRRPAHPERGASRVRSRRCARRSSRFTSTTRRSSNRRKAERTYITIRSPINTSEAIEKQRSRSTCRMAQFKVERSERVGALVGGELAQEFALGARPRYSRHSDLRHLPVRTVLRGRRDRRAAPRRDHHRGSLFAARAGS